MVKSQGCSEKISLKKGLWTPEEDQKLIAYISRYGIWNWNEMPKYAGLLRCGKSCRLRWVNYLRPDIKRGNFTQEENEIITKLHQELGNQWSAIASNLPGRTDNEIKNHWSTHIMNKRSCKKKIKKKKVASTESLQGTQTAAASRQMQNPPQLLPDPLLPNNPPTSPQLSTYYSSSTSSSSCSANEIYKIQSSEVTNYGTSSPTFDVLHDFWEQPFTIMDGLCMTDCHEATYTDPGFMVSAPLWGIEEDYIYPSANSYYDAHEYFWSAF